MIPISYPSPRVSQLDAHILDSELFSLLKEHLSSIFHLHNNSKFSYDQHPELYSLLLNLLIFKLTVWKTGSSYGLSLQNLKLTDIKNSNIIGVSKRSLLLAVLVGGYAYEKLQSYLYGIEDEGNVDSTSIIGRVKEFIIRNRTAMLTKIDKSLKIANLINFTVFLVNGKYPSVIYRILGISLTPVVSDLLKFTGNNVNYEFQNRQLVWNVMTEFLVFILPLLQLRKLGKMTRKLLRQGKQDNMEVQVGKSGPVLTPYTNLPISECAICHENNNQASTTGGKVSASTGHITNPYITNCGHIYCYVCIATRFNVIKTRGEDMPCLRCGQRLEWFNEFGSDELAIDEDAIMVSGDEEETDEEKDEDDENASVASEDEDDIEPYEALKVQRTTTRIDRRMSAVSTVFAEDSHDSESSEADFSEDEYFNEEEAFM